MKNKISFLVSMVFCVQCIVGQTVDANYLNPKNENSDYKFIGFGNSSEYISGFMWNKTNARWGDGDDFSIYTVGNRDLTFKTGTGNFIVFPSDGGKVGIGTTSPQAILDVNKSINNFWSARIKNSGGDSFGLLIKNGYGGSQSHNIPTILQLEDNSGNIRMKVQSNGKMGVGVQDIPNGYKLAIGGRTIMEEVKVQNISGWPDFVFENDYNLPTLEEVEKHIQEKGHLQDIPSAKEVIEKGIHLGEMNAKLLQKIEELMLYVIEQQKMIQELRKEVNQLKKK
ncbi:hypothetical protein [Joostella sp. CR20]|uniref:hypothetical protein n=1 Tax=Joostella sp. CR20 TaxID=2804312 RepID=UPI00313A8135